MNSEPRIGKYINKDEFHRQFPPGRVKDTIMNDIYNASCVSRAMTVFPVLGI